MIPRLLLVVLVLLAGDAGEGKANPPTASYIFPAGGQRGNSVPIRVGGLFLGKTCFLDMTGPGIRASRQLQHTPHTWFEGPLLPLPDSQQADDYPREMAGQVGIASDAPLGAVPWRVWTSQGATSSLRFMVGDLPEIVEQEIEGDPLPVAVRLPVTINGRIFPRENVDIWTFDARKGQSIACEVWASRLGSPLDSRLEVFDPKGIKIAENDDCYGSDSFVRFTAASDGKHQVRIQDVNYRGGQAYVYRLTLTADPYVERLYPLGGQRGRSVSFELHGQGLPAKPVSIPLPATGAHDFTQRFSVGGKLTNPFLIDLDDLSEYVEAEPNDEPGQVRPLAVPAVLNGRIGRPGDIDWWAFSARKGETYDLDLRALRLGSPLEAVVTLTDPSGKELARADAANTGADPALHFTAATPGTYHVSVAERFHSHGGPAYAYRLRVDHPPKAGFDLRLGADALTLPRGGQVTLKVLAERTGGFAEPIDLTIEGLPAGVTASNTRIGAGQGGTDITFKAGASASIRTERVTVRGTAVIGGHSVVHTAALPALRGMAPVDTVLLAVALPTPFKIKGVHEMRWAPRGTVYHRHYHIDRGGFAGPIEVRTADHQARHLQGVTGPTITVPSGVSDFDYPIQLPPWMETGRTCRVCVMGTGTVKEPDGTEHAVSFSSGEPNEQIILVVEPGRLGIDVDKTSFVVEPGKSVTVPVRVSRSKGLKGPIRLELVVAPHIHGVSATPAEIAADRSSGGLPLHFAPNFCGPINVPFVIRATVMDHGEPVVAETKVAFQMRD
jgi:hypothetical protein